MQSVKQMIKCKFWNITNEESCITCEHYIGNKEPRNYRNCINYIQKIKLSMQTAVLYEIEKCQSTNVAFIEPQVLVDEIKEDYPDYALFENIKYINDKKTKLQRSVEQALFQLNKKGDIKQKKRGHWIINNTGKYKPKICQAIKEEHEIYCPDCKKYFYKISSTSRQKQVCPDCKKPAKAYFFRYHCPVRNMYIGNPEEQCELINDVNRDSFEQVTIPMKKCYCIKASEKDLEIAKRKVKDEEEKMSKEQRYYSKDITDPLSKYYMPKLKESEN